MVFTSIPAYLDPANWQQHQVGPGSSASSQGLPPPPPPPPPQQHGGGGAGSIRPGSMADRARMANIPMPEPALKCPRCESTNTKFCYFNNYNLTQPRHFCKTCRRYWTRGGALRNVPVGGGCRRNKRSKGNRSKSPVSGDRQTASGSTNTTMSSSSCGRSDILGLGVGHQVPPHRFMAPLHHHADFGGNTNIGLNYGAPLGGTNDHLNFQIGSAFNGSGGSGGGAGAGTSLLTMTGFDQWRLQQAQPTQFPFLGGLESSYQFESGGVDASVYGAGHHQVRPKISSSMATQMASVKMEDSNNNNNRSFLGIQGNDQYWGGTPWTDLSSLNSSSTSNNPL